MNPAFVILVVIGLITLWFFLSGVYKPFGKFLNRIFTDSYETLTEDDEEGEK